MAAIRFRDVNKLISTTRTDVDAIPIQTPVAPMSFAKNG